MAQKFYSETGERDYLSPKILKISKECTLHRKVVHIPELRLIVYTRINETVEETKKRYLRNTFNYGEIKIKENDEIMDLSTE
jgi:hypothetical protein